MYSRSDEFIFSFVMKYFNFFFSRSLKMIMNKKEIAIIFIAIYIGIEYYNISIPTFVKYNEMSVFSYRLNTILSRFYFQFVNDYIIWLIRNVFC
jgi:hypothetical protein